ncbi:MAG: OmpA family protein [Roseococcus sp.]|nr:OmpA family protein [Roseococcus sp.]
MRSSTGIVLATAALLVLGIGEPARPAMAQADPATQRLIDQLRFSGATRGMVRPQAGAVAEPQPAPVAPASAARPAVTPQTPAAARPAAPAAPATTPPATTAPPGVPSVSVTIVFGSGSAVLTPAAMEQLNPLGRALVSTDLAAFRFRIEGHTDTVGPAEENRLLSERRANAVRDYLVERFGIAPTRLVTEGLGESRLLVPTPDETPQQRNRRVQILNLGS